MSKLLPCGGSDRSSDDAIDVSYVPLTEVVPFACPTDSTFVSIVVRHQLDRRVSDRVTEVEPMWGGFP